MNFFTAYLLSSSQAQFVREIYYGKHEIQYYGNVFVVLAAIKTSACPKLLTFSLRLATHNLVTAQHASCFCRQMS
jgi:hypothetical protein